MTACICMNTSVWKLDFRTSFILCVKKQQVKATRLFCSVCRAPSAGQRANNVEQLESADTYRNFVGYQETGRCDLSWLSPFPARNHPLISKARSPPYHMTKAFLVTMQNNLSLLFIIANC